MAKRALITGVNGQDGSYLAELLIAEGCKVIGLDRSPPPHDLPFLGALERHLIVDVAEAGALAAVIGRFRPDELYYLAAHHFSSQTEENRSVSLAPFLRVNLLAPAEALEAIATDVPDCRYFYAASAHVFGAPESFPQDERTARNPDTAYGVTKCAGMDVCRYFRTHRGVFASVGILYNHESPRRGDSFVTSQIAKAAAMASRGGSARLVVKNLDAVVDWGAAQDYVRAMRLSLLHDSPGDYVIASGIARTVREFAQAAFAVVDLRAEHYVVQEGGAGSPQKAPYVGDSSKIRSICGWRPKIPFSELVRSMVEGHLRELPLETSV